MKTACHTRKEKKLLVEHLSVYCLDQNIACSKVRGSNFDLIIIDLGVINLQS